MKVVSYTALHYGKDYLYYAIRSVIDHVDEHHVLYSPVGSHGHRTDRPCPDTRWELISEATRAAGDKLRWHDGNWRQEGEQRDSIFRYAPDADVILVVDSDEVWPDDPALWEAVRSLSYGSGFRRWRLPMVHFWRSFRQAILRDPAYPERIICPHGVKNEAQTIPYYRPIAHLGYAQRSEIVAYKWLIHGHLGEYRRDCDWFRDRFMNLDAKTDLHPVGSEYWSWESVDPLDYMPPWIKDHPYFNLEVIE